VGPLQGVRVVELAGIGPAPFCGMVLADMGAEVTRVDRVDADTSRILSPEHDLHNRGKRSIAIDLTREEGVAVVLELVGGSEILIEGMRPGVTERLGIGPETCLAANPALVYGRMTGWGQDGPLAEQAGHDIDYIAVSGALGAIGTADTPIPPLNLVGDYGGGGMLLVMGVLAALIHSRSTGTGQVVDAAMVDGSALLTTAIHGLLADGLWRDRRAANILDGAAPFYTTYRTADDRHIAVGALEPRFYVALLEGMGLEAASLPDRDDRSSWAELSEIFAGVFAARSRDDWVTRFAPLDACVAPVLTLDEASGHPHNVARSSFVAIEGVVQPAPAPRFSATPTTIGSGPVRPGQDTSEVLASLGFSEGRISKLRQVGAVS
jgi:alpha-methylacyl-CoA racemase